MKNRTPIISTFWILLMALLSGRQPVAAGGGNPCFMGEYKFCIDEDECPDEYNLIVACEPTVPTGCCLNQTDCDSNFPINPCGGDSVQVECYFVDASSPYHTCIGAAN